MPSFWQNVGTGIQQFLGGNVAGAGQLYQQAASQAGNWAFGDGTHPGAFGTGMYQTNPYQVDPNAANIPAFDAWQQQMQQGAQGAAGRAAPQLDPSQQAQFRQGQQDLVGQLQAQANGTGPSLAQGQLQRATEGNIANAYAMGASLQPNSAGAQRDIANRVAQANQGAAADSAQLRLQEQMQARNQLGQVLAGARGQDIGMASENAQLQGQQNALNDQAVRWYLGQGMSLAQAQQQANMQMQQLQMQNALGFQGLGLQAYQGAGQANANAFSNWMKAISGGVGAAAGMPG